MIDQDIIITIVVSIIIFIIIYNIIKTLLENNVKPISVTDEQALKYFKLVYGDDVPKTLGNKDFQKLDILWEDKLQTAKIDYDSMGNTTCPNINGQVYKWLGCCNGSFDIPNTQWIYHPPPYKEIPSFSWIEVTHCLGSWVTYNEQWGAWYYKASGSNMWLNIGNSIAFKDHVDAIKFFDAGECKVNKKDARGECAENFKELVKKARDAGYNTIQFLNHADMRCGNTAIEVLHVDRTAVGASLPSEKSGTFKSGWWNSEVPGIGPRNDCNLRKLGSCEICVSDPVGIGGEINSNLKDVDT